MPNSIDANICMYKAIISHQPCIIIIRSCVNLVDRSLLRVKFLADLYSIIFITQGLSEDDLWGMYKKMVKIFINNLRIQIQPPVKKPLSYIELSMAKHYRNNKMAGTYSSIYSFSINTINSVTNIFTYTSRQGEYRSKQYRLLCHLGAYILPGRQSINK